jgi:succinylglutamate desuccinylase
MYEEMMELSGENPGPTSIVLAGVHGNERCGVEALGRMLPSLKIQKGRVLFGYGSPRAIMRNVRLTESDLNAMFKPDDMLPPEKRRSYEYARAQFLKPYLDQADVLLDIHASNTPGSPSFAICESNASDIVRFLPVSIVASGFDQVQPGGTDYYMNQKGKIGICIECGYVGDPASTEVAQRSITAFLVSRGHIGGELQTYAQSSIRMSFMYITRTGFLPANPFKDFESVAAGQLIGVDGREEVRAQEGGIILFSRNRKGPNEEAFLLGKYL